MTPLVFAVAVLAVYRLTLLVVADEITEPARDWVIKRYTEVRHRFTRRVIDPANRTVEWECECGEQWDGRQSGADGMERWQAHIQVAPKRRNEKLAILITCPWCASMYVAALVVAVTLLTVGEWGWWWWAAGTLAASGATGFLAAYAAPEA